MVPKYSCLPVAACAAQPCLRPLRLRPPPYLWASVEGCPCFFGRRAAGKPHTGHPVRAVVTNPIAHLRSPRPLDDRAIKEVGAAHRMKMLGLVFNLGWSRRSSFAVAVGARDVVCYGMGVRRDLDACWQATPGRGSAGELRDAGLVSSRGSAGRIGCVGGRSNGIGREKDDGIDQQLRPGPRLDRGRGRLSGLIRGRRDCPHRQYWRRERNCRQTLSAAISIAYEPHKMRWMLTGESWAPVAECTYSDSRRSDHASNRAATSTFGIRRSTGTPGPPLVPARGETGGGPRMR